jgi:hypothetical protein
MDIQKEYFSLMKDQGHLSTVWLFPAEEQKTDPFENTTKKIFSNPIPIQAVVKTYTPESLRWKFYGTIPVGSKQIICEKRFKNLFKIADKIKIGDEYFKTWRDDQKGFGIIEREEYLSVILQIKTQVDD